MSNEETIEQPKRIQVTPENATILAVGLLNNIVAQNRVIIEQLSSISVKLNRPAMDLGGPDGINLDSKL